MLIGYFFDKLSQIALKSRQILDKLCFRVFMDFDLLVNLFNSILKLSSLVLSGVVFVA